MALIKNIHNIYPFIFSRRSVSMYTKNIGKYRNNFHSSAYSYAKLYVEKENQHAYRIMEQNGYTTCLNTKVEKTSCSNDFVENFEAIEWNKETPQTLFRYLMNLGEYCTVNNINISDTRFDSFIDNLTDKFKCATDEELKSFFISISQFPATSSIRTRNFIEIWAALDDECLRRVGNMSFDEMLSFMSLFYLLNITRFSDFSHKCLLKLSSKAKKLTKAQIVQTMFYIGVMRSCPYDVLNLEICIEDQFSKFDVDELAIISMGFFKSKTPIRSVPLCNEIIDKIIEQSNNIHEVSLAALLKVIRYSVKIYTDNKVYELLDCLQHQVPRLSTMCNVHIALAGTATLTLHEGCMNAVAQQTLKCMPDARLKDLERLALTYGTFGFTPNTTECFVSSILKELDKKEREEELNSHGSAFASCVSYLGLLGVYPGHLMDKVLNPEFLENTYGKYCFKYGRETLTINNNGKIFCKDSIKNFLKDKDVVILAKKYTDYVPDKNYKKQYNATEKMFMDIEKILQDNRGGNEYVIGDHIISHHQRGDIIICNDHQGLPMPVANAFAGQKFGLLRTPPDDNKWIVLVVAGKNAIISNTGRPTGHFESKVRELNGLGFYAATVSWSIYSKYESVDDKIIYLNSLIKEALSKQIHKLYS